MRIINAGRQTGKSTYLLKYANEHGYTVLVSTISAKNKMKEEIILNKYHNVKVFTVHEFLHGLNGARFGINDKVCVDNLDAVLEEIIGFTIDTATCCIPFSNDLVTYDEEKE